MHFSSRTIIVVVVYQLPVQQSSTIQCLRQHLAGAHNCSVLIYDNSLRNQSEACQAFFLHYNLKVEYYHNPANPGVAAAYNFAGRLAHRQQATCLVLFDQDTDIPPEYFQEIAHLQGRPGLPLLWVPQVQINKGRIVSPNRYRLGRFWLFKPSAIRVGELPARNLSAINSGLIISMQAFDSVNGYNEDFPLDMSDHVFLYRYKQQYKNLYIMQAKLLHSLSGAGRTDKASALRRFGIQKKASFLFSKQTGNYFYFFWCIIFGIRQCIRYRTVAFLNPFRKSFI